MRARRTLAFKLIATGLAFLLVALASIALTLWVTWKLEGGAAAVNEAGRMRMMSYRLALEAASGETRALPAYAAAMDGTIALLREGDPSRPLFVPWSERARRALDDVESDWSDLRARWLAGDLAAPTTVEVASLVTRIDAFVAEIEARLSHWTEVLRVFQLTMVALAIGGAVLMLYTTHLMVLDPLRRLGQGIAAIRGGDFRTRVQLAGNDEFGELSAGFNAMAERLETLYGDLEHKVEEKTARLEVKRERLAALYEMSAFVAQAETLDDLARGFAAKMRRIAAGWPQ
jgi:two-component system nitrate/nitrite sensor histidine kinase NarX